MISHQGLVRTLPSCGFGATKLSEQLIPPYDNLCSHCGQWVAGYDGHFSEQMREIELVSLTLAQSACNFNLSSLIQYMREAIGITGPAWRAPASIKAINAWFKDLEMLCDFQALAEYFTNAEKAGQGRQLPPLLRNKRSYHVQTYTQDPLHPLAHLLLLQHAGFDLMKLLGSGELTSVELGDPHLYYW